MKNFNFQKLIVVDPKHSFTNDKILATSVGAKTIISKSKVFDNLEERNFFNPPEKKPIMLENLRSIFYKMNLSEKETRSLSSVFAVLTKKRLIEKT